LQEKPCKFIEYVHIKQSSASVKVGDRVVTGQPLCLSGDVGFCPSPHLHIQVRSQEIILILNGILFDDV
jgi:murein DD-endopeptidase MepM/ murein hydrolase activator NlpD